MLKREDIRIRDPFILTDTEKGCYYMYGTTALEPDSLSTRASFSAYRTLDLENFEGPFTVFDGEENGFWATVDYWAPEVHRCGGRYYMFASFKAPGVCRATQILVSDDPLGRFVPLSDKPATPADWECLDGTLYREDGIPYLVFSHEWLQVYDGQICAVRLTDDLSGTVGEPFLLFRASDSPYVRSNGEKDGHPTYVTDGPFFLPCERGVEMVWSSFNENGYAILTATAPSLRGPWTHLPSRYAFDGGHCMCFTDLQGQKRLSLHAPNTENCERAVFLPID